MGTLPKCSRRPLPDVVIRRAKKKDLIGLGDRLRQEDKDEILAGSGLNPQMAINLGWKYSFTTYVVLVNGQAEIVFGAVEGSTPNSCVVWMLATKWLESAPYAFLKQSKPWLTRLMKNKEIAYNWVDVRNMTHIRWLDWVGADFVHLEPEYGHQKLPFLLFILRKK